MHVRSDDAVFLILMVATMGFLCVALYFRYRQGLLRHTERMAALDKGLPLPDLDSVKPRAPFTPRVYLLRGLMWLFVGISITLLMTSISISTSRDPSMMDQVWRARQMRDNGATEEQIKQYMANPGRERTGMPLGAAAIGLVPMSIGAAYLLFYKKETQV